jgi:putative ABC transport system substrate-binding protein
MKKIIATFVVYALLIALNFPVGAQQSNKVYRNGFLSTASLSSLSARLDAFRQGLRVLGYIEGKNIIIEYRSADGNPDRLPELAAELVRLKVEIIFAAATTPTRAAKQATSTIPIVMGNPSDPIQSGFIASLARPGGNITGLSSISGDLAGKRLELLKEIFPKLSRVAFFEIPGSSVLTRKETESVARFLKVNVIFPEIRSPDDLEKAFRTATTKRASAVIIGGGGFFNTHRQRLIELAVKHRMPVMYTEKEYVIAGGLMTYAASIPDMYRRAAWYVDKILKGANPAELPVEQPMRFEFVVNLKAAKQIGLTIPPNVLVRATEVIR